MLSRTPWISFSMSAHVFDFDWIFLWRIDSSLSIFAVDSFSRLSMNWLKLFRITWKDDRILIRAVFKRCIFFNLLSCVFLKLFWMLVAHDIKDLNSEFSRIPFASLDTWLTCLQALWNIKHWWRLSFSSNYLGCAYNNYSNGFGRDISLFNTRLNNHQAYSGHFVT